ncbi:MAG: hypothetical protein GY795_02920 [Desulfobacterales bacterium]|nr:hypothetical protein [Desulfobacterales bacterium]
MKTIHLIIVIAVIAAIFLVISLFQQTPKQQSRDPELIAKVGPNEIKVEQFIQEMEYRSKRGQIDRQALLEEMIEYETLLVKAVEAGLDKDPEVIRAYRNLLVGKFKSRNLTPLIEKVNISDTDVKTCYDAHRDDYTRPAKARLAILYMETHKSMPSEKIESIKNKMSEAREKALVLTGEKGFGKLAISFSEDQVTRYKGGDLGWVNKGQNYRWDEKVVKAGFALEKIGDTSDIVATDTGIYLVKLMDRRKSELVPIEKVNARIEHRLILEKKRETEKTFRQDIRASVNVEIFPDILETVPMPKKENSGSGKQKPPALH